MKPNVLPPTSDPVLLALREFCKLAVRGKCHTQEEVAVACGLSRRMIYKIEESALTKLRTVLTDWLENASDEEIAELLARRATAAQAEMFGVGPSEHERIVRRPSRRIALRKPRLRLAGTENELIPGLEEFAAGRAA